MAVVLEVVSVSGGKENGSARSLSRRKRSRAGRPPGVSTPFLALVATLFLFSLFGPARAAPPADRDTGRDLTVLPLFTVNVSPSHSSALTHAILQALAGYHGLEVRERTPNPPLDAACLRSATCLQQTGRRLSASQLLVGVASQDEHKIRLTLALFDVPGARLVQRVSIDLVGAPDRYTRILGPVLAEIARAAGGRAAPEAEGSVLAAGGAGTGETRVAASTGSAPGEDAGPAGGEGAGHGEPEPPHGLDELLDLPLSGGTAGTGAAASSAAASEAAGSGSEEVTPEAPVAAEEVAEVQSERARLREERKRRRALERQRRKENRAREKERKEIERQRELELKAAAREAEERRKQELLEARARQLEAERKRKEEEKRRAINQKRARKGLPPLPEPESSPDEGGATRTATAEVPEAAAPPPAVATATPAAAAPASGPGASAIAGMGEEPSGPPIFLENESPWQVGAGGGLSYFQGFGLLGTGVEVAYARLSWLWIEGGVESLHGKNPDTTLWFYLIDARIGAVVRRVDGPLHPYGGLDLVGLVFGESAWAWGGTARTGLDIMVSRGFGFRVELAGGVLYSDLITQSPYDYPDPLGLFVRLGVGLRYRF